MKNLFRLVAYASALLAPAVRADQHQWNPRAVAEAALTHFPAGAVVISYCSECDGERAEVWQVERAVVSLTELEGYFAVQLFARRLFRTAARHDSGAYAEPARWEALPAAERVWTLAEIDLAYVYVRQPDGSFRVLADVMKLEPLVCEVKTLHVPPEIDQRLPPPSARHGSAQELPRRIHP